MRPNKGDLVYIPSQVALFRFNESKVGAIPADYVTLKSPKTLLLTESELSFKKYYKVWYNGSEWYVASTDIKHGGAA